MNFDFEISRVECTVINLLVTSDKLYSCFNFITFDVIIFILHKANIRFGYNFKF